VTLLLFYLTLAIGVSFVCSLCEAALLTLTHADAELMSRDGRRSGAALVRMKEQIDRPLAAILTLNTISHTVGAAGVGAQAIVVFGDAWVGAVSAVLTLLILVVSEIIPKTIGASYARPLAAASTYTIVAMIWLTWPIVVALNALSRFFQASGHEAAHSREQLAVIADLASRHGVLAPSESAVLDNILRLQAVRVADILTPRTVTFTLPDTRTVAEVLAEHPTIGYTRIPVHAADNADDLTGVVLKHEIYEAALNSNAIAPLASIKRDIHYIPDTATALHALDEFARTGHHLFAVVDERGIFAGIVTLEDVIESILGTEIVDETDTVADLRALAFKRRPGVVSINATPNVDAPGDR